MANSFEFSIDITLPPNAMKELEKATEQALREVSAELSGRFESALDDKVWDWPRPTAKNGKGTKREITDDGGLKQSGGMDLKGLSVEFTWSAEYAAAVHDGAYIYPWGNKDLQKVQLPARPWTNAVLFGAPGYSGQKYDFTGELQRRIPRFLS